MVIFLFKQCMLSMFSSMVYPMLYSKAVCLPSNEKGDYILALLAGTVLVGDGIATLIQTTFGTRLKI